MLGFLTKRLSSLLLLLLAASVIAFFLPRLAGGDAAQVLAGSDASAEQVEAIREELGLNRPVIVQYVYWIGGVATGDFGTSLINKRPVSQLVMSRMSSTLELAIFATVLMAVLGTGLGVLAGSLHRGAKRAANDTLLSVLVATPPHVTGLILILIVGVTWQLLPVSGEVSIFDDPVQGFLYLLLPGLALALPQAGMIARLIQARMYQVQQEDFVDLATSKGVSKTRLVWHHVLRNSVGTAIVATGVRVGELLAGAVVIEAIFARNGLGAMAVNAVSSRDYQLLQIVVLFAVLVAALVHLVSEILLASLDPRIRLEKE
ncbi:ABC transporter permease [Martelella sp. FOR1707]